MKENKTEPKLDPHTHCLKRSVKIYQLFTVLEYQDLQVPVLYRGVKICGVASVQDYTFLCPLCYETAETLQIISSLSRKLVENSCLKIF